MWTEVSIYFWLYSCLPCYLSPRLSLSPSFFLLSLIFPIPSPIFLPSCSFLMLPVTSLHPFLYLSPFSPYLSPYCLLLSFFLSPLSPAVSLPFSRSVFQCIAQSFVSWLRSLSAEINCGSVNPSPELLPCIPADKNKQGHVALIR